MVLVSDRAGAVMSLDDCRCPVCLEIYMEPVTLPCTHTFCKTCFLESVDKATLCCPLCRKRVSTWARLHSRTNTLVDQQLWTRIQTCFPLQCQRRLSGQDAVAEDDAGASARPPRVCQPGELRQEYEAQVSKLSEEKRALEEEERRASEEFIQRLLAEEEALQQEEKRRREEDERLARLLSSQLNSPQETPRPDVTPVKKKEVASGQIDKFLSPRQSPACSSSSNKENFLATQTKDQAECAPPSLDYYDPQTNGGPPGPPDLWPSSPSAPSEDHLSVRGGPPCKRRSSETNEEAIVAKQVRLSPPSSSSSLEVGDEELLSRQQQEEEDRRLALLLQKELDQEEKQRATDRRKGSSDAYLLRQHHRGAAESRSSITARRASVPKTSSSSSSSSSSAASLKVAKSSSSSAASLKVAKSSSSSSASLKVAKTSSSTSSSSSLSRRSKQATLTEMFSTLSS